MSSALSGEGIGGQSDSKGRMNFFADLPCPMKQRFRDAYEAFETQYFKETGQRFYSVLLSLNPDPEEKTMTVQDIKSAKTIDDIPDMVICYALDVFSRRDFIEKYIRPGCFEKALDTEGLNFINRNEFDDPCRSFNSIGFFPQIVLVDKKQLGNRPVPASLESLMDPVYEKSIVIPSLETDDISTMLLHHIYQNYGEAGLDKIEKNIRGSMESADAVTIAGQGKSGAAVYLVPWVFAQEAAGREHTEIVWPSEGALAEPMVLMIKKDRPKKTDALLNFLLSPEVSQMFAENFFISADPGADTRIPAGGKIKWLGWNYIYNNDITAIQKMLTERFNKFLHICE
ncbi:MAG: ABC transporter substrate-binding protein [Treponema sp.]|jgi:ABC-type Fe3+ transport system substrate-binding protein|nr:ABC transporter substrate-binding protein [Treponema sp.]